MYCDFFIVDNVEDGIEKTKWLMKIPSIYVRLLRTPSRTDLDTSYVVRVVRKGYLRAGWNNIFIVDLSRRHQLLNENGVITQRFGWVFRWPMGLSLLEFHARDNGVKISVIWQLHLFLYPIMCVSQLGDVLILKWKRCGNTTINVIFWTANHYILNRIQGKKWWCKIWCNPRKFC